MKNLIKFVVAVGVLGSVNSFATNSGGSAGANESKAKTVIRNRTVKRIEEGKQRDEKRRVEKARRSASGDSNGVRETRGGGRIGPNNR